MKCVFIFMLVAACAWIAAGQTGLGGRRSLTQQTPSEVILTEGDVSRVKEVVEDLTNRSVLVLAVNRIQLDEPLPLKVPVTIKGKSTDSTTVITCSESNSSAFEIMTDGVFLENLVIQGCGSPAVRLERPPTADGQPWKSTFNGVRFQGNGDLGNFGTFLPTGAIMAGGAIGAGDGFVLTVNSCYFAGNVAPSGAGISVDGSSLSVVNSTFEDNTVEGATFSGGAAISVTNSLFPRVSEVSLSVASCTFVANKDLTGEFDGNTLTLLNGAPLERAEFIRFQTPQPSGGAIHASRIANLEIVDSVFSENIAVPAGGAVFSRSVANVEIKNCSFSKNRAQLASDKRQQTGDCSQGGALYAEVRGARSKLLVEGTMFDNNSAICGGALHLVGAVEASVKLQRCVFEGNFAKTGGAVLIRNIFAPVVTRTRFTSNVGRTGGAVLLTNEAGLVATDFRGDEAPKFEGNVAVEGGAIAVVGGGVITLESIPFLGNHALDYGGALAVIDGSVNSHVLLGDVRMVNNTAARGGAMFLDSVNRAKVIPTGQRTRNLFQGNVGEQGAAVYYQAESKTNNGLQMQTVDFIDNVAVASFAAPSGSLALTTVVDDRTQSIRKLVEVLVVVGAPIVPDQNEQRGKLNGGGGGVFLALQNIPRRGSVEVKLQDAAFRRNGAQIGGGLIVLMTDGSWGASCQNGDNVLSDPRGRPCRSVLLVNAKFVENSAQISGGAISTTHPENIFMQVNASQAPVRLTSADLSAGAFVDNEVATVDGEKDVGKVQI